MKIIRTKIALQRALTELRHNGKLALVPTMGALHEGHLSLIDEAKKYAKYVVVSIFVNPTQFCKGEDFSSYPKNEKQDIKTLRRNKVDLVYIPSEQEIYQKGFSTQILVTHNTDILCGRKRSGHFNGVALIITKFLLQLLPDMAIFGEKDYQQLCVIKQLVLDLDIPVKIIGAPIIREKDGLAMSSRNTYLTTKERKKAAELFKTLKFIEAEFIDNKKELPKILKEGITYLLEKGFDSVDYLEIRNAENLELIQFSTNSPSRIFVAARLGKTRLIDNKLIS